MERSEEPTAEPSTRERGTSGAAAARLAGLLERELGRPIEVRFGRSRRLPVIARAPSPKELARSPRLTRDGLVVRLHAQFEHAPASVHQDLARWLKVGRRARRASQRLDHWIDDALRALPAPPERPVRTATRGRVHDLAQLTQELLQGELAADYAGKPAPTVTWGERRQTTARRTLRLGSYDHAAHLVRIHPVLDQPGVPAWFVRAVLFHELLHGALPIERDRAGRWIHHPPEFRRRERARPEYAATLAFERRHLGALLRSTRTGLDMVPRSGARAQVGHSGPGSAAGGADAAPRRKSARRNEGPGLFD